MDACSRGFTAQSEQHVAAPGAPRSSPASLLLRLLCPAGALVAPLGLKHRLHRDLSEDFFFRRGGWGVCLLHGSVSVFLPAALHLSVDGRWGSFHLESRVYRENDGERLPGTESGRDRPVCTTGKFVPACVCVYERSLPVRVRVSLPNTCPPPFLLLLLSILSGDGCVSLRLPLLSCFCRACACT